MTTIRTRRRFKRDPHDWYCESRYAVEALLDHCQFFGEVYDPACGRGNIPEVFRARGNPVRATDLVDRGYAGLDGVMDFLTADVAPVDNIVTNPPYNYRRGIAEAFIHKALSVARRRVAVFVPIAFTTGMGRYDRLFSNARPSHELVFAERMTCPPGRLIEAFDERAFKGGKQDFIWLVWTRKGIADPQWCGPTDKIWIAPRPLQVRRQRAA